MVQPDLWIYDHLKIIPGAQFCAFNSEDLYEFHVHILQSMWNEYEIVQFIDVICSVINFCLPGLSWCNKSHYMCYVETISLLILT